MSTSTLRDRAWRGLPRLHGLEPSTTTSRDHCLALCPATVPRYRTTCTPRLCKHPARAFAEYLFQRFPALDPASLVGRRRPRLCGSCASPAHRFRRAGPAGAWSSGRRGGGWTAPTRCASAAPPGRPAARSPPACPPAPPGWQLSQPPRPTTCSSETNRLSTAGPLSAPVAGDSVGRLG